MADFDNGSIELEEDESPAATGLPDEGVAVELNDDDDDDDNDDDPEKRETRRDRRRERGRIREENERLRDESTELRERLARLEGQSFAQQQQQQQPQGPTIRDVYHQRMKKEVYDPYGALNAQQQAEIARHNGKLPEDRREHYEREAAELNLKQTLIAQDAAAAATRPQTAQQEHEQALRSRYPDVMGSRQMRAYAESLMIQQQSTGRHPPPGSPGFWQQMEEVTAATRKRFAVNQGTPPDRHTRDRYSGVPRGASAPTASPATTMRLSKEQMGMAEALYDDLPPKKAHKKWAQNIGRRSKGNL